DADTRVALAPVAAGEEEIAEVGTADDQHEPGGDEQPAHDRPDRGIEHVPGLFEHGPAVGRSWSARGNRSREDVDPRLRLRARHARIAADHGIESPPRR